MLRETSTSLGGTSMSKKSRMGLAILIVIVAFGYLIYTGMSKASHYYLTVTEVMAETAKYETSSVKINGDVVPGSISWNPSEVLLTFEVTDGDQQVLVEYIGAKPDNLEGGSPVILTGRLDADGSTFLATEILTQCPSKYEGEEITTAQGNSNLLMGVGFLAVVGLGFAAYFLLVPKKTW